jgi:hypothetical protein
MTRFTQLLDYIIDADGVVIANLYPAPFPRAPSASSPPSLNGSSSTLSDETSSFILTPPEDPSASDDVRIVSQDSAEELVNEEPLSDEPEVVTVEPWNERFPRAR